MIVRFEIWETVGLGRGPAGLDPLFQAIDEHRRNSMAKMTLWEMLTKKKAIAEFEHYNPLHLRIGNTVKIDTIDTADLIFTLQSIREVTRRIDGEDHKFCDYDLTARPYGKDEARKRLRLIPREEKDRNFTHDVVLFEFREEFPYEEGFHDWLKNNFEVVLGDLNPNDPDPPKYWRVNDLKSAWEAKTVSMRDEDGNGKIDDDELRKGQLTYWDFWRNVNDEGGNKVLEFYNVEMDQDGMFSIWVGRLIDPLRVSVI